MVPTLVPRIDIVNTSAVFYVDIVASSGECHHLKRAAQTDFPNNFGILPWLLRAARQSHRLDAANQRRPEYAEAHPQ
jgi:hypothetical protein